MYLKKLNGDLFPLRINDYYATPEIVYKLVEKSDRGFLSVDRGLLNDRYETTLTIRYSTEYIHELEHILNELRDNNEPIQLSNFEENIFGDHVNYVAPINCLMVEYGKVTSPALNVSTVDIELLGTSITGIGTAQIPQGMHCVSTQNESYGVWNTKLIETYYGYNNFIDRVADIYIFKGDYILTIEENSQLYRFWQQQRGNKFTIQDGDFGVPYMFGEDAGDGNHEVIINVIEYYRFSPTLRQVTIELVKVG